MSDQPPSRDQAALDQEQRLAGGAACKEAAIAGAKRGWSMLSLCPPDHVGVGRAHKCNSPGKRPWHHWNEFQKRPATERELRDLWARQPNANVGLAYGQVSGLIGIDVDGPGGEALLAEKSGGDLPATLEFKTAHGRRLLYGIPDGATLRTTTEKPKPGEELRLQAQGAQTVMPPSRHASGKRYEWKPGHGPDEIQAALAPAWLLTALAPKPTASAPKPTASGGPSANGHTRAFAGSNSIMQMATAYLEQAPPAISGQGGHATTMRVARDIVYGFDLGPDVGYALLENLYNARCQPPWSEKELRHKCQDAHEKLFDKPRGYLLNNSDDVHLTDLGNARRVVKAHGQDLRYVHPWKKWLAWDRRRWRVDDTAEAVQRVKRTQSDFFRTTVDEMRALGDASAEDRKEDFANLTKALKHALKWEAAKDIAACLDLAKSEPGIPILPIELDTDPFLLNVLNGTLDLRTGRLREHRREDRITKLAPVDYAPDAQCPLWLACLSKWMNYDENLVTYLRRVIGYCLTAAGSEQALWFLYGLGANGKTTFLNAIRAMFGEDYSMQANPELLMQRRHEQHPTERFDLFGKRFVAIAEVDEGRRLAESLVKQMTGGEKLRARRMREDFVEFDATHKTFLAANHKPEIRGTDHAIWRRIKLVPFTVTIAAGERDKQLPQKLKTELPGILAWAVRGCMDWQRDGLGEPEAVTRATEEYRGEMDVLATFIEECCEKGERCSTKSSFLFERYKNWSGDGTTKQMVFSDWMETAGYVKDRKAEGMFWKGIGLKV